jgi:hypothetical protein
MTVPLCAGPVLAAVSDVPYDSYTWTYRLYIEFTPAPYIPAGTVSGTGLGIGQFRNPQDLCIAPDGLIYVADTDNHRIVVLSNDLTQVAGIIETFDHDGSPDTFDRPSGVTVSDRGLIYVADTNKSRIVVLDGDRAVQIIDRPRHEMLGDNFVFSPLKLAVDYAGRIYVVANNVFQGIMVFSSDGEFQRFFGTIEVTTTLWQRIWRRLSTKAQRERGQLFIPTEFTGVDVDEEGFVYASCIDPSGQQAAFRLNPKGQDVIKTGENGHLGGDVDFRHRQAGVMDGPSTIVDIIIRDKGIYSILDSRRGRIFSYDNEGNLLYIFGGRGEKVGTFKAPRAMASSGGRFMVLDAERQEILLFTETEYGSLINQAVGLRYDGNERLAVDLWQRVLVLNENLELANVGIGKAYLSEGSNREAMKHLKLGMNRTYYSIAFKRYRNQILKDNLGIILTMAVAAGLALYIKSVVKSKGSRKGDLLADE